jgi:hypothetical protein
MADEFLGQVVVWNEAKKYGFIEYMKSGDNRRMFFIRESCQPDALGRIGDCFVPDTLVKFSIERQIHRGEGRLIAADVRPAFREEFAGDVDAYRETGQIVRWLISTPIKKNGFLQRPSGEHIYFQAGDVVPGDEWKFKNLTEGDYLYYSIGSRARMRDGALEFRATCIQCYDDNEQSRLRQGLPLVEEPAPVSTPAPEPASVLAPSKRNKTILELVKEQRNGNTRPN